MREDMGVFVTREHVCHSKSGIAHRGRTRVNHLRELPTKLDHFAAVGRLPCPAEPVNHRCTFGMRGAEKLGRQLVVPKCRAAVFNLEKQVIPRAALGAQNDGLSYETDILTGKIGSFQSTLASCERHKLEICRSDHGCCGSATRRGELLERLCTRGHHE
jgi:hypothetical protein